jgi:tetratricopeptide (TPR) repeat protein
MSSKKKSGSKRVENRAGKPAATKEQAKTRLSPQRLWLFRLIGIGFPFALLLLAEMAFRIVPSLSGDRDPNVNISPVSIFSRTKSPSGEEYYNVSHQFILNAETIQIPVKKPANTIRIFCLGSSACAGWPHPPSETFSAYLQQAMRTAYPGKQIEIVNVAAHGFAAYRTRRVLEEVLTLQPDAVLVWEGNNEFLEERHYDAPNWLVDLAAHLRTVQWARSAFFNPNKMSGEELKGYAQFFWKKIHQQSLRLREDPAQFAKVQEHFRLSFEHMVKQSQRAQVPIILCTVPVNLRDWLPTVSHNGLSGDKYEQWRKLYLLARRCLLQGKFQDGIDSINQAIAMEGEHAESYFWLGRLREGLGQKAAAYEAFSKARDKDYNPFRALSSFNETIRDLARINQQRGVYLLDLEQLFAGACQYSAPGFDMFLDYVHPTKPGNVFVAKSAYELITRESVVKEKPAVEQFTYHDVLGRDGKPYRDHTDERVPIVAINMATENHQYETVLGEIEAFVELKSGRHLTGPDDPLWSSITPEAAERYRIIWNYWTLVQREIMGQPVTSAELLEAKHRLDAYYEKSYPLGTF